MATTVKARGQITIVDLNDAKQIMVYLQNSGADTQLYNSSDGSYTPNFESAPITLTPYIAVTGESSNQIACCNSTSAWEISDNGSTFTLSKSVTSQDGGSYTMDSNGVLTIKKNLEGNNIVCRYTATYTDTETQATTELKAEKTIIRSSAAAALFQAIITTPKGTIFDTQQSTASLTAVCTPYRGTTPDTSGSTFTWYALNVSSGKWEAVDASSVSTASNVSTLTVSPDDVLNAQMFKCVVDDDGSTAEALVLFTDVTDPYVVEVGSTTGDKIVNGTGSTTVFARVYRSGELVENETATTKAFTYTWTKYNKNGTATNWSGTSSTTKTGNPIEVLAADVDTRATIFCEVSQ